MNDTLDWSCSLPQKRVRDMKRRKESGPPRRIPERRKGGKEM